MSAKRKCSLVADSPKVSLNDAKAGPSTTSGDPIVIDLDSDKGDHVDSDGGAHLEVDGGQPPHPLLGLDDDLTHQASRLIKLIYRPIADKLPICHLRDVPFNAIWSRANTLSDHLRERAIVIVAFSSLTTAVTVVSRNEPSLLTVAIEVFTDTEKDKLQHLYDLAQPGQVATRHILAHRSSTNSRSRLLNVYDQSAHSRPAHRLSSLSVNELLGGDVVRVEMRCMRVRAANGFLVKFKLKSLTLLVPVPCGVDIMQ